MIRTDHIWWVSGQLPARGGNLPPTGGCPLIHSDRAFFDSSCATSGKCLATFQVWCDMRLRASHATSFANNGCLPCDSDPYCDLSAHLIECHLTDFILGTDFGPMELGGAQTLCVEV